MQSGVILLVLAMCLTPGVDVLAKQLTAEHSPFTVAFFRYFAGGLTALCAAKVLRQPISIPRQARGGQILRTALLVGSMTSLIAAFSMVPMAYAVGGFLISPIVSVLLCVAFFGEKLTPARVIGVVLSLLGAVLIAKPAAGIELGTVFALAGGALLGAYLALTRGSSDTGGALSTLTVQCFLGAILVAPMAFWSGMPEINWPVIWSIAGLGVFSAGAHFLTVAAYERADATVLSPFMYFNLIAAVVVGYFWFNEVPSGTALIGLFAIASGGLVTVAPTLLKGWAGAVARLFHKQCVRFFPTNVRSLTPN